MKAKPNNKTLHRLIPIDKKIVIDYRSLFNPKQQWAIVCCMHKKCIPSDVINIILSFGYRN